MKKLLSLLLCFSAGLTLAAQSTDKKLFNHLGLGAGVGTTGITIEAATPITKYVQLRAGVAILPSITFKADADYEYSSLSSGTYDGEGEVELKGDLGRVQGHLIFNLYPFPKVPFYVAAGAYFGGNKLLKITGKSDDLTDPNVQAVIGDFKLPADENGRISGGFKINGFRPYLGIGFGRSVPNKLLSFNTELGVQFEGKPELYTDYGEIDDATVKDDNTFNKVRDVLRVYPVLTFRLNFRAF